MNRGTILYAGGFEMPDRNAAAHRVSSIGKIFGLLGYHTVFLGVAPENEVFDGVRKSSFSDSVFEISHPLSTAQWFRHVVDASDVKEVCGLFDNVKMVILYNEPFFRYLAVKKAFSGTDIRVIYDCTEWVSSTEGSLPKRIVKGFDAKLIRTGLDRAADGLIVISKMMKNGYRSNGHTVMLPPMVDTEDGLWHQAPFEHPGTFEFCFAGTMGCDKESIDKLVRAFIKLKNENARLRMIGVSGEDFAAAYPELSKKAAADSRIMFMGRLSHQETVRYVLSSDCYIFIRESNITNNAGFSTKFVEAFTCKVPVITTDTGELREYIEKSGRGRITSVSKEDICAAMEKEIDREEHRVYVSPDKCFDYREYTEITRSWLDGLNI